MVQNNEDESNSLIFHSVLSQIAQDNWYATKILTKNAAVISDNKV